MAKIKPTRKNIIIGYGSKIDAVGTACDIIGMTDVPVVSQGAELISAGISFATGDYIGAAMSVGSMLPVVGKVAEAAKAAHKAKKVADGVSSAQKEAKLLTLTARKTDNIADGTKHTKKTPASSSKQVPPHPSKTQAKTANNKPAKETQIVGGKLDIQEGGLPTNNLHLDNSMLNQPTQTVQKRNFDWFKCPTNSNPPLNNKFRTTGSPLYGNVSSATSLFGK